jgi:hypothetical protein
MMADSPRCVERSVRIYAALIKAYPASFRQEYADEMVLVFRELATDAWQRRKHVGLAATSFCVLIDLVRTVPRERLTECKPHNGGTTVTFKSLLTRKLVPDELNPRLALVVSLAMAILILGCLIHKLTSMNLTEPQLFFGIVLGVALATNMIGCGLLAPLESRINRSRYLPTGSQIVVYSASVLVVILGIWKLASMAITEYELILGLLIIFELMAALFFIAGILPLLQAARAQEGERQQV